MGGTGVCFCCDCARLLWGESLTLYLLLGTTCLLLLDTGSHLHPNVKLLISESVWFCWGQKPSVTPHNNPLHVRPSSLFSSFSGSTEEPSMDTSVAQGWQQALKTGQRDGHQSWVLIKMSSALISVEQEQSKVWKQGHQLLTCKWQHCANYI